MRDLLLQVIEYGYDDYERNIRVLTKFKINGKLGNIEEIQQDLELVYSEA